MHELSITEHLLEDCLREAKQQNASRIRVIRLCIGELRGIVPDCIQIYLDMLAEGISPRAQGSNRDPSVKVHCLDCGRDGEITRIIWNAPLRQPAAETPVRERILYQKSGGRYKWRSKYFTR